MKNSSRIIGLSITLLFTLLFISLSIIFLFNSDYGLGIFTLMLFVPILIYNIYSLIKTYKNK